MSEPNPSRQFPRVLNPLWIVSLFLGLSEVTAGLALTQSSGWIQGLLAVFAVAFPATVAAIFFSILWRKHFVLYAPGDFSESTPVDAYMSAMNFRPVAGNSETMEEVVRIAVSSVIPQLAATGISEEQKDSAVEQAVDVARDELARKWVDVDITAAVRYRARVWTDDIQHVARISATGQSGVDKFLNWVWYAMQGAVPAHTYGAVWILCDASGNAFKDMGTRWAKSQGRKRDLRTLNEVGIELTSTLVVQLIGRVDGQDTWTTD
jgi:hypothetical protein